MTCWHVFTSTPTSIERIEDCLVRTWACLRCSYKKHETELLPPRIEARS